MIDISPKQKYVHYDNATGKIFGFYHSSETIPIPEPNMPINDILYNLYFDNLSRKHFKIINKNMVEVALEDDQIGLSDYKALKNAELSYEGRLRQSKPFSYEGNFYDVYNLRRNYFDQRFIEEISTKKTNEVKIQTINDRTTTMTSEQFLEFYISFIKHIKGIQDQLLTLLDQVFDANNREEVDAVAWPTYQPIIYPAGSKFLPFADANNTFISFKDAPDDGKVYGRQHREWVEMDLTGGTSPITPPSIDNPPANGKIHGRIFDQWVPLSFTTMDGANPPNDGKIYGRKYTSWEPIVIPSTPPGGDGGEWQII